MKIRPIRQIQNFRIKVYGPDGYIGIIRDEIQLMDFQIQIKRAGAEGYYITHKGKKFTIRKDGKIPNLNFDEENTIDKQLEEILDF